MYKPFSKLFLGIAMFLIFISQSVSLFAQQLESQGITKRKTSVYFGPKNKESAILTKGTSVSIIDVDVNYFSIKYKGGVGYVVRNEIEYNKEEINKYLDQKEKGKATAIQEAARKAEAQKAAVPDKPIGDIYGVTKKKTSVYAYGKSKESYTVGKGQTLLLTGSNSDFFITEMGGVKSQIYKRNITDFQKLDSLILQKAKIASAVIVNGKVVVPVLDPLTEAGDYLLKASSCRMLAMGSAVATTALVLSIKEDPNMTTIIGYVGSAAALGFYIANEVFQFRAAKLIKKKGLSISTTSNGIGMVYKF